MENKHDWLFDDIEKLRQKIRFKDRIVYKVSGKLHNPTGPAIIYFNDEKEDEFYLKGIKYDVAEWEIKIRAVKIKRILNKVKQKKSETI